MSRLRWSNRVLTPQVTRREGCCCCPVWSGAEVGTLGVVSERRRGRASGSPLPANSSRTKALIWGSGSLAGADISAREPRRSGAMGTSRTHPQRVDELSAQVTIPVA